MFFFPSVLLKHIVAFLFVGQSCFAARIPARVKKIHDLDRRQQVVCQEQVIITKILVLVPVRISLE